MEAKELEQNILRDMQVVLSEEFDRNFERKAFFSDKWKARRNQNAKGSLLIVTSRLRRSIKGRVDGHGVRFTSDTPYAAIHNEGGKITLHVRAYTRKGKKGKEYQVRAHTRTYKMPKRQFVGDGKHTQELIRKVIETHVGKFDVELKKRLNND